MAGRDPDLESRLGTELVSEETRPKALRLLAEGSVGFLAMGDAQGPYVVPVSFAFDGERLIYHGGRGKKSDALAVDPRVCLAVVSDVAYKKTDEPCKDTFFFRSLLVYGVARRLQDPEERSAALRTLVAKYHPDVLEVGFRPESFSRTIVYGIEVRAMTYREQSAG